MKLLKHEIPRIKELPTEVCVRELKYSLVPIENASATRLENPMTITEFLDTLPAIPPAIITNDVTKPSIDPKIVGLNIVFKSHKVGSAIFTSSETGVKVVLYFFVGGLLRIPIEPVFIFLKSINII